MEKQKNNASLVPVVHQFFDFYLEDISIGVHYMDGQLIPVIEDKNMFVPGTLFIPNVGDPKFMIPSDIICDVTNMCRSCGRGDITWHIYELEYYSRSAQKILKQFFAVRNVKSVK